VDPKQGGAAMAREPEKSTRETGKSKNETASGSKGGGSEESGDPRSGASEAVEFLKAQHREFKAVFEKRWEGDGNPAAIAREFASLWLPHNAVEQEILIPALRDAAVDDQAIGSVEVHKDIINLLLADLLENGTKEFARAKVDALAKQVDALVESAEREGQGLFEAMTSAEATIPSLNSQIKARTSLGACLRNCGFCWRFCNESDSAWA
jgi:hypothetical protein